MKNKIEAKLNSYIARNNPKSNSTGTYCSGWDDTFKVQIDENGGAQFVGTKTRAPAYLRELVNYEAITVTNKILNYATKLGVRFYDTH